MSILVLLLSALLQPIGARRPDPPEPAARAAPARGDEEYERRLDAAGKDTEALWELYLWCVSTEREREATGVLHRIVRIDEHHRPAREKLGHVEYDGQWFTSERKLEAYKEKEADRRAKELGHVKWKGEWVAPEDLSWLKKGYVRDPLDGRWISAEDLERRQQGWMRQDLDWIPPEEVVHVEAGLFKVGDRWLTGEEADEWHSQFANCWKIPGEGFVLWTTLARKDAERAVLEMQRVPRELERIFGALPTRSVNVVMLRDVGQYDSFCNGEAGVRPDRRGYSRLRQAFLTDSWIDTRTGELRNEGVGIWDVSSEARWWEGLQACRLAYAMSSIEALDPSPETSAKLGRRVSVDDDFLEEFFKEKRIPSWIRWGAATYVERFFIDNMVETGGNAHWAPDWTIGRIRESGGLDPLDEILALQLQVETGEERARSEKLIDQAGLLIAFSIDGSCQAVAGAHEAFRKAFAAGKDVAVQVERWERALAENLEQLTKYARL